MPIPLSDISSIEKEVKAPTQVKKHLTQSALKHSIKEGAAANFSMAIGNRYIIPFALLLKANAFQVGMLSALAGLASPISQLFGSKLMENQSRKKIVLNFVLLQSLMWLPIAALSWLAWKGVFPLAIPYILIILFTILVAFGGISFPAWFSWMGDLVPEKDRGQYFSIRNRAIGVVGISAVLIGALLLDFFKTRGLALLGFSILFLLAFTFRGVSYLIFKKQYSPEFKLKKGYYFSFFSFLKRFDNFGKFAVYKFFFYFSLALAAPFFTVYMLEELSFSYMTFIIVSMSASAFYLIFAPLAGKFSDRYGNTKLLWIGTILFALGPILWIFFTSPIMLIAVPQLILGLGNAALIISFTNFTYDSVSPQRRGICSAYTNLLVGFGLFLGSLSGGALIKFAPINFMNPILFVFLLSGILILLSGIIFLPSIKDERKTKKLPTMHVSVTHPFKSIHEEIGWFRHLFK
jgi:MFS family permease